MELVREEGEGEVEEGEVCRVEITIRPSGPPVKEAEPVITLLKVCVMQLISAAFEHCVYRKFMLWKMWC